MKTLLTLFCAIIATTTGYCQQWKAAPQEILYGSLPNNVVRPADLRLPAAWEETQAVIISWPYMKNEYDAAQYAETFEKMNALWAKLATAIQQECEVWIRIYSAQDSAAIKSIMEKNGVPLRRYKFLVHPGESFWARDYGPIGFYYSSKDSIGIIDTRYHHAQSVVNADDELPGVVANQLGAKLIRTPLFYEYGNLNADGQGTGFFTSRIHEVNSTQNKWSSSATLDSVGSLFHLKKLVELADLHCDGGTGHVDMFFKMLDEQTIVLTELPELSISTDKAIIDKNVELLSSLRSPLGTPYKIIRVPLPTSDNGKYDNLTCEATRRDPRTYLNGLFVNKSYLLPIFSDEKSGNAIQDAQVIALFKRALPGYKIVPIDSRILSRFAGGIHCLTITIPAENPIRFALKKIPEETMPAASEIPVELEISNCDGIRVANIHWRKKGTSEWIYERMSFKEHNIFAGSIDGQDFWPGDTIEYFFKAKSFNGKVMTKPMTAPEGCYTFVVATPGAGGPMSASSAAAKEKFPVCISPMPVNMASTICFTLDKAEIVTVTIYDIAGNTIETLCSQKSLDAGPHTFIFNGKLYNSGTYTCSVSTDKEMLRTKRFFIQH